MHWNILNNTEAFKEITLEAIRRFPCNLEMKHSYAHVLREPLETIDHAIRIYRNYIESAKPQSNKVLVSTFNLEYEHACHLMEMGNFEAALQIASSMSDFQPYKSDVHLGNIIPHLRQRILDRQRLLGFIKETEERMNASIRKSLEKERSKSIELLGLFSAIIAFILSTTSTIGKEEMPTAIQHTIAFGLVLILFVLAISWINDKPKDAMKDTRTYVLILFLAASVFTSIASNNKAKAESTAGVTVPNYIHMQINHAENEAKPQKK